MVVEIADSTRKAHIERIVALVFLVSGGAPETDLCQWRCQTPALPQPAKPACSEA